VSRRSIYFGRHGPTNNPPPRDKYQSSGQLLDDLSSSIFERGHEPRKSVNAVGSACFSIRRLGVDLSHDFSNLSLI
jgi:hypothetical protein